MTMKLLSAALPLFIIIVIFILKYSLIKPNKVGTLAKVDTMRNANDIDFNNASRTETGGYCNDINDENLITPTTETEVLNKFNSHYFSRSKRFIAFPVGSSFSTAVCLTTGVIGNPDYRYLSMGLNWGIAYNLPNISWILKHANGFGYKGREDFISPQIKRRHRRDLYDKIEILIDSMGYNGRACILRALCESKQYFQSFKMGMIGEMLRVIFSLPKQRIFKGEINEFSEIKLYDQAYRRGYTIDYCSEQYDCNFSLLELAFGKYSTPPQEYYTNH